MSSVSLLNPGRIDFAYIDQVTAKAEDKPSPFHSVVALFRHAAQALVRHPAVVHYISDNGNYADAARGEIITRLHDARTSLQSISGRPGPHIEYHDIPSQDTNAAAFDLAQFARGAVRGFGNVFFVNCAPRKKQRGEGNNKGETVYVGILPNGALIGGTGEDAFVHFKDLVKSGELNIYKANVAVDGTQFRSRDYFPWLAVTLGNHVNRLGVNRSWKKDLTTAQRDQILFGLNLVDRATKLDAHDIPDLGNKGSVVARADTHGNLKLGSRHGEVVNGLGAGSDVIVLANDHILRATVTNGSFDKKAGNTVISAGSSGRWKGADGNILSPFAEIFTIGEKAREGLAVSETDLKKGVDVHFIPARLFQDVKARLTALEEHLWEDRAIAKAIVDSGYVAGLDHGRLKTGLDTGEAIGHISEQLKLQDLVKPVRVLETDRRTALPVSPGAGLQHAQA